MSKDFIMVPVKDPKQIRLIKLLHNGSLPLSKVRTKLNDNRPKLIAESLNLFFSSFIDSIEGDDLLSNWKRAEIRFLVGHGISGERKQIFWLDDNVEILKFHPDNKNPTLVTLRVWRKHKGPKKVEVSRSAKVATPY